MGVGDAVGATVGVDVVGEPVGDCVGDDVVGESVGDVVGEEVVGEVVGASVGLAVGADVQALQCAGHTMLTVAVQVNDSTTSRQPDGSGPPSVQVGVG